MTINKESMYWHSNKAWYTIVNNDICLTESGKKIDRVRESFEMWNDSDRKKYIPPEWKKH